MCNDHTFLFDFMVQPVVKPLLSWTPKTASRVSLPCNVHPPSSLSTDRHLHCGTSASYFQYQLFPGGHTRSPARSHSVNSAFETNSLLPRSVDDFAITNTKNRHSASRRIIEAFHRSQPSNVPVKSLFYCAI